jgi:hypothetical protein
MTRIRRAIVATAATVACAATLIVTSSSVANAEATSKCPRPAENGLYCLGTVAAGLGLNARQDLNGSAGPISGGRVIATIPNNSTVYIRAWWRSATETGPLGPPTDVWDAIDKYKTPDGVVHDLTGFSGDIFVSDAWVNTGGNTQIMVNAAFGCC